MKFDRYFGQFHRLNYDTLTIARDFVIGFFFELENILYHVFSCYNSYNINFRDSN